MNVKKFIEQYANRESENKLLKGVILILVFGIIVEGLIVIYLGLSHRTIIVPSHIDRKFYVEGDNASKEYLEMMARYSVELISNYTPETALERFQEFLRFINSSHYNKISPQLLAEAEEIKKYSISQYYIPNTLILERNAIKVVGIMRQYSQDKQILQSAVEYKLKFQINKGRFEIINYEKIEQKKP